MSALTGLFISQSYGGVIHLSTNTGIVPSTPTLLEDGFGNSLGLFIRSNGSISGSSFTGSLAGTASFAIHAQTASFALNATSNFPTDITVAGAQIGRMTSSLSTNLLFGSGSLTMITTSLAQRNIVIGDQSLNKNITSSHNIVVGHQSLQNWDGNGGGHVAIGNNIAEKLTGPNANGMVLIGYDVLSAATSHSYDHTAVGYGVLFSHVSGTYNVGIGQDTLTSLTSGSNNVAIGGQAMENTIVSSNSTVVGYESGYNSFGDGNTLLGTRAGRDISGSFNTFIGADSQALVGYFLTGSNNTIVGARVNVGVGNKKLENNIILADGEGNIRARYSGSWTLVGTVTANVTNAISSSFAGHATTASFALTASSLLGSITSASYALSSSYAMSASIATSAVTASYAVAALTSSFALNGPFLSSTANNTYTGNQTYSGSINFRVIPVALSSNTASLNLVSGSFFTVSLANTNTYFTAVSMSAGQSIIVQLTQNAGGNGTATFNNMFTFPSGSSYVPFASASAIDVLSFVSFDGVKLRALSQNNFI
jgi:hypothetical protein